MLGFHVHDQTRQRMTLSYHEICLTIVPQIPWEMPPVPAITIRGALGEKVRRTLCSFDTTQTCMSCTRKRECNIPQWFDPGVIGSGKIRPYILQVLPWPTREVPSIIDEYNPLHIRLVFLEPMIEKEAILQSIHTMLAEGLGKNRIPHYATQISINGESILLEDNNTWSPPRQHSIPQEALRAKHIKLVFRSPIIPPKKNRPEDIYDPMFFWNLAVHRIHYIHKYNSAQPPAVFDQPNTLHMQSHLSPIQIQRFSKRQDAPLYFSGYIGSLHLKGTPEELRPFWLAQPFQIGRASSMGCGSYIVFAQ